MSLEIVCSRDKSILGHGRSIFKDKIRDPEMLATKTPLANMNKIIPIRTIASCTCSYTKGLYNKHKGYLVSCVVCF
jgi:hypothetical protein